MSRASTRANLLMLQAWIHHWECDAACNLTPTPTSFASAKLILERLLQEIDAPEKEGRSMTKGDYIPLMKAGPLRNGAERGHGTICHAVWHNEQREIWMTATDGGPALCGQMPRIQWSSSPGETVTCPRCIRLLDKAEGRSND